MVPVNAARSPKGQAHVVLTIDSKRIQATLFEGPKVARKEVWDAVSRLQRAGSGKVSWHPNGSPVVLHGDFATCKSAVGYGYALLRRAWQVQPRETPALDTKAIAGLWATFAAREFRLCRKDAGGPYEAAEYCARARWLC